MERCPSSRRLSAGCNRERQWNRIETMGIRVVLMRTRESPPVELSVANRLDLRHAYAVLGLAFGAPLENVTRQYRRLVRTWHPDRFAADATNAAEAAEKLRLFNHAYGDRKSVV